MARNTISVLLVRTWGHRRLSCHSVETRRILTHRQSESRLDGTHRLLGLVCDGAGLGPGPSLPRGALRTPCHLRRSPHRTSLHAGSSRCSSGTAQGLRDRSPLPWLNILEVCPSQDFVHLSRLVTTSPRFCLVPRRPLHSSHWWFSPCSKGPNLTSRISKKHHPPSTGRTVRTAGGRPKDPLPPSLCPLSSLPPFLPSAPGEHQAIWVTTVLILLSIKYVGVV